MVGVSLARPYTANGLVALPTIAYGPEDAACPVDADPPNAQQRIDQPTPAARLNTFRRIMYRNLSLSSDRSEEAVAHTDWQWSA